MYGILVLPSKICDSVDTVLTDQTMYTLLLEVYVMFEHCIENYMRPCIVHLLWQVNAMVWTLFY